MAQPIDLMIAGAQKAGTTSILRYLGNHRDVTIQSKHEFVYFIIDEEYEMGYARSFEKYFEQWRNNNKLLFAKSAGLMYSAKAAERLKEHNPGIHMLCLLRNPVERAYSAYWYAIKEGWETLRTFEDAINAEPDRLREDPFKWRHCAYIDRSLYCTHIRTLHRFHKKKQVHIFIYDDFKRDPLAICKKTLSLFDLNTDEFEVPPVRFNKSAGTRSVSLVRLINTDNFLKRLIKNIFPENITYTTGMRFKKLAQRQFQYPPMNPETRKRLIEFFGEPNEELGKLIKRDLKEWNE